MMSRFDKEFLRSLKESDVKLYQLENMKLCQATVSQADLDQFEKWNKSFGSN